MRLNVGGSKWYMDKTDDATGAISVGGTREFVWDETGSGAPSGFLAYGKSYVIRVMTTTGFYYELVASTPFQ